MEGAGGSGVMGELGMVTVTWDDVSRLTLKCGACGVTNWLIGPTSRHTMHLAAVQFVREHQACHPAPDPAESGPAAAHIDPTRHTEGGAEDATRP